MTGEEFVTELGIDEEGSLAPNDRGLQMVVEIEGEAHAVTGVRFNYPGNAIVIETED